MSASLTPFFITGYAKGLINAKKPFLLPDQAWSTLENAYVWRERELKREGNFLLGRLQRVFTEHSFFLSSASPWSFNILAVQGYVAAVTKANPGKVTTTYPHGLTTGDEVVFTGVGGMVELNGNTYTITVTSTTQFTIGVDTTGFTTYTSGGSWISNRTLANAATPNKEPNAQITPGSFVLVIGSGGGAITFTDNGDGTLTGSPTPLSNFGFINYATGAVVIHTTASASTATTVSYNYYPGLPGMGIWERELPTINEFQTLWWDTRYCYVYSSASPPAPGAFSEFIPGTSWFGTNSDFFWAYNYFGAASNRLLFVTNFVSDAADPMYYTDGSTWTTFIPAITATTSMFQARILIAFGNRFLAFNTWEGTTSSGAGSATNYFARCRFSAEGNPTGGGNPDTGGTAWRQDIFGQGGFLDAPTSEQITGVTFIKNTLLVDFEYSTWQLRYLGEYGLPFIWERVSSDFGSGSTFSGVLFDNYRLTVGDVGITRGNAVGVDRIDLDIPDQVFDFQNEQTNNGAKRIWGVRDFQKELIFWNYVDAEDEFIPLVPNIFPNKVLVYNYRNETWAIFRENVTCFGTFQIQEAPNWSSPNVYWNNEQVLWRDPTNQTGFPAPCILNQQGFAHTFASQTQDDPSLSVSGVSVSSGLLELTIINHNLESGEIIYLQGLEFVNSSTLLPVTTSLNNTIYKVEVVDANTVALSLWNTSTQSYEVNFTYTPVIANVNYVGGGVVTLFPRLNIITKDINLYQQKGLQTKMSRVDFLLEPQPHQAAVTANLILNASPSLSANILMTPTNFSLVNSQGSDYRWFSFYQTLSAQYFRIQLTYDDDLMNTLTTHQSNFTLYAINAWTRPGGRMANV